jgi:hypothetical protein
MALSSASLVARVKTSNLSLRRRLGSLTAISRRARRPGQGWRCRLIAGIPADGPASDALFLHHGQRRLTAGGDRHQAQAAIGMEAQAPSDGLAALVGLASDAGCGNQGLNRAARAAAAIAAGTDLLKLSM